VADDVVGTIQDDFVISLLSTPITTTQTDYSCTPPPTVATQRMLNNFHMRGTALGGWLVLEPWLTPSLFYQFLGASERWGDDAHKHVGLDSRTFCEALGGSEANRQLRNHWKAWVTDEQIHKLAANGVSHLRVPVGDWMFMPYEPYIGCWDGSLEELDRGLQLCQKYNIKVIIDLHALRRSQVS
jgi:glucan 1,3-beta-glucosidase